MIRPKRAASGGMTPVCSIPPGRDQGAGRGDWLHRLGRPDAGRRLLAEDALPIGLAAGAMLTRAVEAGETVARGDVELQVPDDVLAVRQDMERSLSYDRSIDR